MMRFDARTAVVIFNLGGPDSPGAVHSFLFNLFSDPLILRLPNPLRWLLAKLIAWQRTPIAQHIYSHMGGRSPIVDNTVEQAQALERRLSQDLSYLRVFVGMRYWHPLVEQVLAELQEFDPEQVVLLPLYPQWSSTTTASFLRVWRLACSRHCFLRPTIGVCCYFADQLMLDAMALLTAQKGRRGNESRRFLFSAHGLPEKIVRDGDPYQWQCERTAQALAERCGLTEDRWVLCYQSRVGPLKWIGPSTEDEIKRAGKQGLAITIVPIAFVSEHSETLVELDVEYAELARRSGAPDFLRVPTLGVTPGFIEALAQLTTNALRLSSGAKTNPTKPGTVGLSSPSGQRLCPVHTDCPIRSAACYPSSPTY